MNMWEAIVIIVIVMAIARAIRAHYRHLGASAGPRHQSLVSIQSDPTAAREAEQLRRDLAAVTERVKVLERIITDGRQAQSIAEEIEALRDR